MSAGEDGQIMIMSVHQSAALRRYEAADSCSLTSILSLKHEELVVGNVRGQMKTFDLRIKDQNPTSICILSSDQV